MTPEVSSEKRAGITQGKDGANSITVQKGAEAGLRHDEVAMGYIFRVLLWLERQWMRREGKGRRGSREDAAVSGIFSAIEGRDMGQDPSGEKCGAPSGILM